MFPFCQKNRVSMAVMNLSGRQALMLRRRRARRPAARLVFVCHALFDEGGAFLALKVLIIGAEFARRHFIFRRYCVTGRARQYHRQHHGSDGVANHGASPVVRPTTC
jgi:hypothetical protein